MWSKISTIVLKQRILVLVVLAAITAFMAYKAQGVRLQYGMPPMLPSDNPVNQSFQKFRQVFGNEASVFILALEENPMENLETFKDFYTLCTNLEHVDGVDSVVSLHSIVDIEKDSERKQFKVKRIFEHMPESQEELDSLRNRLYDLPFYEGILYNSTNKSSLLAIELDSAKFYSNDREFILYDIQEQIDAFKDKHNITVHYSGFPYIKTIISIMVKKELKMFIALAVAICFLILFVFFRSFIPVIVSIMVVGLGVVWSLGFMGIMNYEISILTSIIPPLVIVIGIPNCIFLINKYHSEYKAHKFKALALKKTIEKIGKATFMTNATTAVGFITFVFTQSSILIEFGIVATFSIFSLFVVSLLLIPVLFTFAKPPQERHTKHLDTELMKKMVKALINLTENKRKWVYIVTAALVVFGIYGSSKIKVTGNVVDDFPKNHHVTTDLAYFENNFGGVLPFEILIDAKKPNGATSLATLRRIEKLERTFDTIPVFSRALSIAQGVKFIKQAYYNGAPSQYKLINNQERVFFKPYIENASTNQNWFKAFIDSNNQITRVNMQIADIGTAQMDSLLAVVKPEIDSIFSPEKYTTEITGTSVVYLEGTKYLVKNLFISLAIAIVIIALIMATLFSSVRMVVISIATNLIPLILTGSLMGYFGIAIKPSTILVFSIAFGISVDDTIHFLAKYRQELSVYNDNIGLAVKAALREVGVSMLYTSIILFFGFSVFDSSEFGGTQALGVLVSFTLFSAMLANLVLLPSLIMTLEKSILTKAFKEPYLEILNEEEDIEYDQLRIKED